MPGFLYYIPGRQTLRREELAELGLSYAFAGEPRSRQTTEGPGGGPAGIVAIDPDRVPAAEHGFWPERQAWRQIPGSSAWLGYTTLPAPEELLLKKPLGGEPLALQDGRQWLCPIARRWQRTDGRLAWSCQLPERLELAADGSWTRGTVATRLAALWSLAEAWHRLRWGGALAGDEARFSGGAEADAAVVCLQANYAVGRTEVAALGLLEDDVVLGILDLLIDRQTLLDFLADDSQKKNRPAGSAASPGPADATVATAPASLT